MHMQLLRGLAEVQILRNRQKVANVQFDGRIYTGGVLESGIRSNLIPNWYDCPTKHVLDSFLLSNDASRQRHTLVRVVSSG
jgi:hypothetical protein